MTHKVRFGPLTEEGTKYTKTVLLDGMVRSETFVKTANDGIFVFITNDVKKIENDSRKMFLQITHKNSNNHTVKMVLDFSHTVGEGNFHLNFTEDSKKILENCSSCMGNLNFLNHYPIKDTQRQGVNIIDLDVLWSEIKRDIE